MAGIEAGGFSARTDMNVSNPMKSHIMRKRRAGMEESFSSLYKILMGWVVIRAIFKEEWQSAQVNTAGLTFFPFNNWQKDEKVTFNTPQMDAPPHHADLTEKLLNRSRILGTITEAICS